MTAVRRRRPPGSVVLLATAVLLVAACASTVPSLETSIPTPTRAVTTAAPTSGPFARTAYPVSGDAPCGEKEAPDAAHGAYRGNLKRIAAKDASTVVFELCGPDVAFLTRIADPAFGIQDGGWLRAHIDPATSGPQSIATEINGTGPYRLEAWKPGTEISLARNDGYWGQDAVNERLIVRWNNASAARVDELQAGTVDGIDEVAPADATTVEMDVGTVTAQRAGLDAVYLGFTNTIAPFDNEGVRRALALGIDRARLVALLPPASELATFAGPCALTYACAGDAWYEFDPTLAKETLTAAGFPDGLPTTIHYSTTPSPSLPDPAGVARELAAQLESNLGVGAEIIGEPEETYRQAVNAGKLDGIHILTHRPSIPDISASLDPRFATGASGEIGKAYPALTKALAAGRSTTNGEKRAAAYKNANDAIRENVAIIPLGTVGSTAAFLADVGSAAASPLHLEAFAPMIPGDRRQMVWLTTDEPPGLYCAQTADAVARLVCSQVVESLYGHDPAGTAPIPSLAERCSPDDDMVVWTCSLRSGVLFSDGSRLDANDVVLSYAVQWDAEHPLHGDVDGGYSTFARRFGGFLNPPPG